MPKPSDQERETALEKQEVEEKAVRKAARLWLEANHISQAYVAVLVSLILHQRLLARVKALGDWVTEASHEPEFNEAERRGKAEGLREAATKVAEVNAQIPWKSEPTVVAKLNRLEAELLNRAAELEKADG